MKPNLNLSGPRVSNRPVTINENRSPFVGGLDDSEPVVNVAIHVSRVVFLRLDAKSEVAGAKRSPAVS